LASFLLIACADVANVQFARITGRTNELAVRTALGGTRWRLVRQLLIESIMLSLAGAAVGLFLAQWDIQMILAHHAGGRSPIRGRVEDDSFGCQCVSVRAGYRVVSGVISGSLRTAGFPSQHCGNAEKKAAAVLP